MNEGETVPMAPGQIRLSNAGVEFQVLRVEGKRVICKSTNGTSEWRADLDYLQSRSKFIRNSE